MWWRWALWALWLSALGSLFTRLVQVGQERAAASLLLVAAWGVLLAAGECHRRLTTVLHRHAADLGEWARRYDDLRRKWERAGGSKN